MISLSLSLSLSINQILCKYYDLIKVLNDKFFILFFSLVPPLVIQQAHATAPVAPTPAKPSARTHIAIRVSGIARLTTRIRLLSGAVGTPHRHDPAPKRTRTRSGTRIARAVRFGLGLETYRTPILTSMCAIILFGVGGGESISGRGITLPDPIWGR